MTLEARAGIEPLVVLQAQKLFILRFDSTDKNDRNAEVGYTAGTQLQTAGMGGNLRISRAARGGIVSCLFRC
jgi:hypothetical protein